MMRRLAGLAIVFAAPALYAQEKTQCSFHSDRFAFDSTAAGFRVRADTGKTVYTMDGYSVDRLVPTDSAEQYPDHDLVIGHASYDEPRLHVTSDFLNYFPNDETVRAVGHVDARLPSGSRLVGPIAEYYLAGMLPAGS